MMKRADRIASAFLLFLSGFIVLQSLHLPYRDTFGPGSAFLPIWLSVLLAGCALALLISTFMPAPAETDQGSSPKEFEQFLVIVGLTIGAIVLTNLVGMIISAALFMGTSLIYLDRKHKLRNVILTLVTPVFLYFLFNIWLGVPLPRPFWL